MELQWLPIGISVLAVLLAVESLLLVYRNQRRPAGPERQGRINSRAQPENWLDDSPANEYFQGLKDEIDSAVSRGALSRSNDLRLQYEAEIDSWRALRELERLAPREIDVITEELPEEEKELLRSDMERAVNLPHAILTADGYFLLGNTYYEIGVFEEAIKQYARCLRVNPSFAQARNNRGLSYFNLGQLELAMRDHSEAISIKPRFPQAYQNRGLAHLNSGKYKEAVQDTSKAIRLSPRVPNPYIVRGLAYVNLGKYRQAIKDYTKALALSPGHAETYNNRGVAYAKMGQHQRAIQDYSDAVLADPEFSLAYSNRGLAFFSLGHPERAIEDYTLAIELDPTSAQAYHNRGLAYFHTGQHQLASHDYEKAASLNTQGENDHQFPALADLMKGGLARTP